MNAPYSISDTFVNKVSSKVKTKHVTCITVADTGAGKSVANLIIGYNCSVKFEERLKGDRKDYFNINHIAIIQKEQIFKVLEIEGEYLIKLLDDIGKGWNSRRFKEEGNMLMNDIVQTFRTDRGITLLTLPNDMLIDSVPRKLMHYKMEMVGGFDNTTLAKFKILKKNHHSNTVYHVYPRVPGGVVKRIQFDLPIDDKEFMTLFNAYEKHRKEIGKEVKRESIEKMRIIEEQKQEMFKPKPKEKTLQERTQELHRDWKAGVFGDSSFKDICKAHQIKYTTARQYV